MLEHAVSRANKTMRTILRLILVTGQRPGEVRLAQKSDFDLQRSTWTLPAEKSKNGLTHIVPLSPMAVKLFQPYIDTADDYLFTLKANKPMLATALGRAVKRSCDHFEIGSEPIPAFTPHDLRRTAATRMAELGTSQFDIDRVQNHKPTGIGATYNVHTYDREKKRALLKWARHLQKSLDGEKTAKVVQLNG